MPCPTQQFTLSQKPSLKPENRNFSSRRSKKKSGNVQNWLECVSPKPLNHGAIWKSVETGSGCLTHVPPQTPTLRTCAPPPGWVVRNGITVPPSSISESQAFGGRFYENQADGCDSTSRKELFDFYGVTADHADEFLGIWYCTKCYLNPFEKPPDFELCFSCQENYYFPFPPKLPDFWFCPGCTKIQKGDLHVSRQCNHCGKEENITMCIFNVCFWF